MTGRVGDYELVRRIGSGGMAEVWMGRRHGVGGATKSVAVKFIIPSKTNSERHREMFLSEARLSMMLSHSNVIQVFHAGEDEGRLYMVMEWVDGMNLAQLLGYMRAEGKRPSLALGGYVIGEVLKGLAYAHNIYHEGRQITIVHRDISPQNVLVSVSGEVKLLDFGVARLAQEETSGVHIKGKLRYMAPEHLGGNSRAPTVDIYGAGAILHELVEGAKYRDGAGEMELYNQILGGQTPALTRADTPDELAALRSAMLDPDEHTRIPSATQALEQLEQWSGYRSSAGELGRLVRGYMGVNTPRSGIHVRSAKPTVDALAETSPPTAATHTRRTGATSPELSASMPGAGTDPSGVPVGAPGGVSQPIVVRRQGLSPLFLGLGAGLLCVLGAAGVFVVMRGDDSAPAKPAQETSASSPPTGVESSPPAADPSVGADAPQPEVPSGTANRDAAAPPQEGQPNDAATDREGLHDDTKEPDAPVEASESEDVEPTSAPKRRKGSRPARKSPSASETTGNAKKPEPPKAKVKVALKLKKPLTVAYVRIDGGSELVLEPMKRISLSVGRHTIMWRPNREQPFVQGGTVQITQGGKSTIRFTQSGPVLE